MSGGVAWKTLGVCRGCHAARDHWRDVLQLDPMPLAGQFCVTSAEAGSAERYPLTWVQCTRCALVQVVEDVDDVALYRRYNYASSSVGGLVRHFEAYARVLAERFGAERPLRVLEIGCNDGVLLRRLPSAWHKIGVDPSDVAARGRGHEYELIAAPFDSKLARELGQGEKFDLITASNCLAHISDLRDVFSGIELLLAPGGELVIEVHDLDALLHMSQWDTIYHEHKAEWSERSLRACLGELGLELRAVDRLPTHGGLLRAWFVRGSARPLSSVASLEDFGALRDAYQSRRTTATYRRLAEVASSRGRLGAYGAAGRANVWLNQHPELAFEYIVDDSPLRVNRFLPVVTTPIVPARRLVESPTQVCLITAWNYAADIRRNNPGYPGQWLTAFSDD